MRNFKRAARRISKHFRIKSLKLRRDSLRFVYEHKNLISVIFATFTISIVTLGIINSINIASVGLVDQNVFVEDIKYSFDDMKSEKLTDDGLRDIVASVAQSKYISYEVWKIVSDDKTIAYFNEKNDALEVLQTLKEKYVDEDTDITNIRFKENVRVVKEMKNIIDVEVVDEVEGILAQIQDGGTQVKTHTVASGETLSGIAVKYSMSTTEILRANTNIEPDKLKLGQEINLVVPKPLITVQTIETVKYTEDIPFETVYEDSSNLYTGQSKVKTSGVYGQMAVVATVIKENGFEVGKEIVSETVVSNPSSKVVLKGTKIPPPTIGTGVLARPTSRGVLTSKFGPRWGRMHNGIDIGLKTGTPVYAADGGKVIESTYNSSLGHVISVDHGGGVVTRYGHLKTREVKVGDKVFKGQEIGLSGNTGYSTGPHLHFEVVIHGTPVNPLKYVKY
jgi:murein DD-endopeptidase MepM/ murein hydrolase activator NlpD